MCDDLREERGGKATLLGFYGVLPHVTMGLPIFDKPLARLMFVVIADKSEAPIVADVSFQIFEEEGMPLQDFPLLKIKVAVPAVEMTNSYAFGMQNVRFTKPGTYFVRLTVDGKTHFEEKFRIRQAAPDELK